MGWDGMEVSAEVEGSGLLSRGACPCTYDFWTRGMEIFSDFTYELNGSYQRDFCSAVFWIGFWDRCFLKFLLWLVF